MVEVFIRPVQQTDLDDLYQLAQSAGPGMTNFPPNKTLLEQKIAWSIESFAKEISTPQKEYYYFVLQSIPENKVVGCSAIFSKAGGGHPFYSYKISKEKVYSEQIGIDKWIEVLHLVHDFHESSEIATLFLDEKYRRDKIGEFLSRVRFLFMSCFRARFTRKVIAEMRGKIDEFGHAPFWDALCQHFFDIDFMTADKLCALGQKQFIVDVMPRCPIYVPLLTKKAHSVMGKVHPKTKPALELLKKEGFRYEGYIDIFDAGPTVETPVDHIYSVRKSFMAEVKSIKENHHGTKKFIVSNAKLNFRACVTSLEQNSEGDDVILTKEAAEILQVKQGDTIKAVCFPLPKK